MHIHYFVAPPRHHTHENERPARAKKGIKRTVQVDHSTLLILRILDARLPRQGRLRRSASSSAVRRRGRRRSRRKRPGVGAALQQRRRRPRERVGARLAARLGSGGVVERGRRGRAAQRLRGERRRGGAREPRLRVDRVAIWRGGGCAGDGREEVGRRGAAACALRPRGLRRGVRGGRLRRLSGLGGTRLRRCWRVGEWAKRDRCPVWRQNEAFRQCVLCSCSCSCALLQSVSGCSKRHVHRCRQSRTWELERWLKTRESQGNRYRWLR